jgi:hypothetical protein
MQYGRIGIGIRACRADDFDVSKYPRIALYKFEKAK